MHDVNRRNRQMLVHVSPETPAGIYPGNGAGRGKSASHRSAGFSGDPGGRPAFPRVLLGTLADAIQPKCVRLSTVILFSRRDRSGASLRRPCELSPSWSVQGLASLRVNVTVMMAPTPGAAWALAAFARNGSQIVNDEQVLPALSPLPPEALRLDSKTVGVLCALGVRPIGSLLQLSRNDLAVRFGPAILMRIDQATGACASEPSNVFGSSLAHPGDARISKALIESLDAIHFAVQELTRQIAGQLAARGQGARELRLTFRQPYASPVEKVIRLVRPCRNESALVKLISCAIENLEASEGFVAATLAVVAAERLGDEQAALIGGEEERDAAELDHLVERLRARLDRDIECGELLESNLPENASRCRDTVGKVDAPSARSAVDLLRPLRLLRQPRSIKTIVRPSESRDGEPVSFTDYGEVHRLDHVRGPERITGQWWNGRWKTRDYFDVLDAAGDRYWIFRVAQSGRWFLHGIFE